MPCPPSSDGGSFFIACCPHPILPHKRFCCTGTGQRILVPQYCPQELMSDDMPRGEREAENEKKDGPLWGNPGDSYFNNNNNPYASFA